MEVRSGAMRSAGELTGRDRVLTAGLPQPACHLNGHWTRGQLAGVEQAPRHPHTWELPWSLHTQFGANGGVMPCSQVSKAIFRVRTYSLHTCWSMNSGR